MIVAFQSLRARLSATLVRIFTAERPAVDFEMEERH
jgi:hypothetical protein